MMMKASHYLFIVFIFQIINTGCNRPEEGIDPAFIEYVDLFIKEAADRGHTFEYSDVRSIRFDDIEESTVNGTCNFVSRDVAIDSDRWEGASESSRTSTIFHELGHCILDRRHITPSFPSGICKSMMAGGEDADCIIGFRLGSVWYTYYNNELFDTETPTPDWYVTEINRPILETLVDTSVIATTYDLDVTEFDLSQNFELIVSFFNWEQNNEVVLNLGEQLFSVSNDFIFLKGSFINRNPELEETIKVRFVQYDGFDYFFVDDEMFHMDNLDLDFTSLSMGVEQLGELEEIEIDMEIELSLLGN